MFLEELKRGIFNKRMMFVWGITLILIYISAYSRILQPITFADLTAPDIQNNKEALQQLIINGQNKYHIWHQSFFYIASFFPLLAILPFSASFLEERNLNFHYFISTRKSFKKYINNKFLVNFIVGGLALIIPELIFYVFISILFKNDVLSQFMFKPTGIFASIFAQTPEIYIWITFLTHFILGGTFSSFALCLSSFIKKKIIVYILPYLLYVSSGILLEGVLKLYKFSPLQWFTFMYSEYINGQVMYLSIFGITLVCYIIFFLKSKMVRIYG